MQLTDFHVRIDGGDEHSAAPLSGLALTRRENEVARLVAEGLTNQQIAEMLVIAPGTVAKHIEHILGKRGFASRVHIATWIAAR